MVDAKQMKDLERLDMLWIFSRVLFSATLQYAYFICTYEHRNLFIFSFKIYLNFSGF